MQPVDNKAQITQVVVQVPFVSEWFHIVPPTYDKRIPCSHFADNRVTAVATKSTSPTSRSSPLDVLADSAGSTTQHVHCRTAALFHTTPRTGDWHQHRVRPDSSARLSPVFHRVLDC